jgi:hypothetical protein
MLVGALLLPAWMAACSSTTPPPASTDHTTSTPSPATRACVPTWTTIALPLPPGTQQANGYGNPSLLLAPSFAVQSLSAAATDDVWAVGQSDAPGGQTGAALAEHWNGTSWSIVAVKHAGNSHMASGRSEDLTSVDAITADDVWAVGFYPPSAAVTNLPFSVNDSTLIEHWNGTSWSIVGAPDATTSDNLNSVSADSSSDIWAVGGATYVIPITGGTPPLYQPIVYDAPLVEHWNGASWKIVPAPTLGLDPHNPAALAKAKSLALTASPENVASADLTSVHAIAPNDVWAAGIVFFANTSSATFRADETFTEHWNGSRWSVVAAPDVTVAETRSAAGDDLVAVAGSSGDVWAVGRAQPIGSLALHWNGSAWSVFPTPQTGEGGFLQAVLDLGPGNVWAAGDEIDRWDGQTWAQMPTVDGTPIAGITAIAAPGADDIWFADVNDFIHYTCPPPH